MKSRQPKADDPDIAAALTELQALILRRLPTAEFSIIERDDPPGIRLRVITDGADVSADDVLDLVIDKLFELQVERELPIYVIPIQALSYVSTQMQYATERHSPIDIDVSRHTAE